MSISVKKIEFDDLFNSTTMFYVNNNYEEDMEREVREKVDELASELCCISTKEGLKKYIIDNKDSLDNLTSLMEISTERFKRMVSMLRKDRGFVFSTEWGMRKIRTAMLDNPALMENVLNLLWDGRNDDKLKSTIPLFYLDNMVINDATINKLGSKDSIRLFVKRGLEGRYSNKIGDLILAEIEDRIKSISVKHGIDYEKNIRVPLLDRTVSFVFENALEPRLILDVSYCVTTSSAQGDKKKSARDTEYRLNRERARGNNILYINFLDGAGWIGRQADMREIHRCSDYVLNFNNLDLLEKIVEECINKW